MENFNKSIHPFSIFYRHVPDFRVLSEKYPKLQTYMNNSKVNFKNPKACALVCKILLKEYFSINYWKVPKGYLIPAVPQRLNYLCWIKEISISSLSTLVDIGTGANVIFPLLGTKSFNWSFIATENNKSSLESAQKIISKNNLEHKIQLIRVQSGILQNIPDTFQASICNPPFFESPEERPDGFCGTSSELCTTGGEITFIKQYIIESWNFRAPNRIFSSLLGIKSHMGALTSFLQRNFPSCEIQTTTLYQGKTLRWALAWKFT